MAASRGSSLPARVECGEIVRSADMLAVDEDLRDGGAAVGTLDHLGALRPAHGDVDIPRGSTPLSASSLSARVQ